MTDKALKIVATGLRENMLKANEQEWALYAKQERNRTAYERAVRVHRDIANAWDELLDIYGSERVMALLDE